MTKTKLAVVCIALLGVVFTFNNCSSPDVVTTTGEGSSSQCSTELGQLEADIQTSLAAVTTDADFAIRVERADGRTLSYQRGTATMQTSYESASTSKWVSATIILKYMESAANQSSSKPLTLSSKPQDFIPSWPITNTDTLYNVTLRDLLSFTSGMYDEALCINLNNANFENCVLQIATANANKGRVPGAEFYYSSSHLQIAGLMAVKARNVAYNVSNSTWQSLFQDFKTSTGLFANSTYDLPSSTNPRLAGGMHWIGDDYFNFLKAYMAGDILSASTLNSQLSDQWGAATLGNSPVDAAIRENWHYGFGLWLECHAATFNCAQVDSYSSPGLYGAYPFMNVKHDYFGMLARQGGNGTFREGYAVFATVNDKLNQWAAKICN